MAVYEQSYQRYDGPLTSRALRFLVIPRYAFQRLSGSKLLWALVVASTLVTLASATLIYLRHNARVLLALDIEVASLLPIDATFFEVVLGVQLGIGFVAVLLAGPALISMDLANGALPLYLARPLARKEYVLGKLTVLAVGLSLITWGYGLLLWLLQASLAGGEWAIANLRIAGAIFAASWIWILVLSFLTLALSALIRWPLAVRGVLLVLFLVLPGFGLAIAEIVGSRWGMVIGIWGDLASVRSALFGTDFSDGPPLAGALVVLAVVLLGSIGVIAARLKAQEVVT